MLEHQNDSVIEGGHSSPAANLFVEDLTSAPGMHENEKQIVPRTKTENTDFLAARPCFEQQAQQYVPIARHSSIQNLQSHGPPESPENNNRGQQRNYRKSCTHNQKVILVTNIVTKRLILSIDYRPH